MGKDPGEIREEIEATRGRMGDTVEAIGYKTDVTGRAKGYVSGKKDAIVGKKEEVTSRIGDAVPDAESGKQGVRRVGGMAQENPLGLAIAGAAVGFLAGLTVPSTRVEDERIGTVADDLKERVRETSQEAFERGKEVAQEAGQAAMETAKERGQEHGQELAASARENAEDLKGTARDEARSQTP